VLIIIAHGTPRHGTTCKMAGASSDFFNAVRRYPVMLLDRERIFGWLEDNTRARSAILRPAISRWLPKNCPAVAPNSQRFGVRRQLSICNHLS
jgi:hypothetical protein